MNRPTISIIAAMGRNRELGAKNALMWHIPGELPRFKQITMGHPIIMGRKTFESIGRVLPGRANIVITRDTSFARDGIIVCSSVEQAIEFGKEAEENRLRQGSGESMEIFIIGGGQIYEQALRLTDKLYLTLVDKEFPEADTFFPKYKEFDKVIFEEEGESEGLKYKFVTLEKSG